MESALNMSTSADGRRGRTKERATYVPDTSLSLVLGIARFLDWAASHRPKEFLQYNEILKNVRGYSHMPRLGTPEVQLVKGAMQRVKKVLHEKYNRGLHSQRGLGVRATTDDLDRTSTEFAKETVKLGRQATKVKIIHESIDTTKIPNTAQAAPWKRWMEGGAKDLVRSFSDPNFARKLLPPVPGTAPEPQKK